MRPIHLCLPSLALATTSLFSAVQASAQSSGQAVSSTASEARATRAYQAALHQGPEALQGFLANFPKGADLHVHLSGAVYAESFIRAAGEDGLCVDPAALKFVKSPCEAPLLLASELPHHQELYDRLVDAFSLRSFVPTAGWSGHDQFFATFDRFGGLDKSHMGEWLDEVATRAASQNEQYLEVMQTPSFFDLAPLWNSLGWPLRGVLDASRDNDSADSSAPGFEGDATGTSRAELSALREKLLAGGLRTEAALDAKEMDDALAARNRIEHCGEANAAAACSVKIRWLYQVLRAFPPQQVFAQTLLAFEVASADANDAGLNFVQPEDATLAMSEYNRQMHMLDYLHGVYPKVHISLHAGELAPGLVPPSGLKFHIREAVELGHAERIGHGVDVMYETNPRALLKEMAARHVMVEINLTSNDVILGRSTARRMFRWRSRPTTRAARAST